MPHICRRCKTRVDAAEGQAPRCPACGGTTFSFVSARRMAEREVQTPDGGKSAPQEPAIDEELKSKPVIQDGNGEKTEQDALESIESIRIIEPGKYDLNLLKLAESNDRVIKVGKDANYRLDLHSMIRHKKKE